MTSSPRRRCHVTGCACGRRKWLGCRRRVSVRTRACDGDSFFGTGPRNRPGRTSALPKVAGLSGTGTLSISFNLVICFFNLINDAVGVASRLDRAPDGRRPAAARPARGLPPAQERSPTNDRRRRWQVVPGRRLVSTFLRAEAIARAHDSQQ